MTFFLEGLVDISSFLCVLAISATQDAKMSLDAGVAYVSDNSAIQCTYVHAVEGSTQAMLH